MLFHSFFFYIQRRVLSINFAPLQPDDLEPGNCHRPDETSSECVGYGEQIALMVAVPAVASVGVLPFLRKNEQTNTGIGHSIRGHGPLEVGSFCHNALTGSKDCKDCKEIIFRNIHRKRNGLVQEAFLTERLKIQQHVLEECASCPQDLQRAFTAMW